MRTQRSISQIHIAPHEPFDYLPLYPRSGHQSLDRTVRHRERTDKRLRLSSVKPEQPSGVRSVAVSLPNHVVRDNGLPLEPPRELHECSPIPVLGRARTFESVQKLSDARRGEVSCEEMSPLGDKAPHLRSVLGGLSGPLADQGGKVRGTEGRHQLVKRVPLVGVVHPTELRLLLKYDPERQPVPVMLERLDHPLDIVSNIFVGRTTREDTRPSIIERDPGLEPRGAFRLVRHGRKTYPLATPFATCSLETTLTPCA